MPRELLSFEEVQELLKCSRSRLYQLLQSGDLPAFKIGKLWRVERRDLEEWLDSKRYEAKPEADKPSRVQVYDAKRQLRSLFDAVGETMERSGIGMHEADVIIESLRRGQ